MKSLCWKLHRWIGLCLAPFFALILISGLFLTLKPMLAPTYSNEPLGNQATQVFQAVQAAEQQGAVINSFALDKNGQHFWATGEQSALQSYSIDDAQFVAEGGFSTSVYNFMKKLHKEFFISGLITEIAAYAMALIMLVGLVFMVRPTFRKNLISWHNAIGVFAWVFLAILPITGIMMTLHLGAPKTALQANAATSVSHIMQTLNEQNRLEQLVSIDKVKKNVVIRLAENGQIQTVQLDEAGVFQPVEMPTYWPKVLHEATWAGKNSAILNFILASGLLFLLFSGCYTWLKRRLRQKAEAAQVLPLNATQRATFLIAYASQTGTAERLAKETQAHLKNNHILADLVSTAALKAEHLNQYENTLLIVSTTGDGELPDTAHRFEQSLLQSQLKQAKVALLALGDKNFEHFCAGGKKIEAALNQAGAQWLLPIEYVDGQPTQAWQNWLGKLGQQFHFDAPKASNTTEDINTQATLIKRTRLDKPEYNTREVAELIFRLPENVAFKGGDLFLVTPPDSQTQRMYSIGSDSQESNEVRLTVGLNTFVDDQQQKQLGKGSDWLLHQLNIGDTISVRLRQHPSFTILENDNRPVIMVAVGTGIAPLVGFLPALKRHARDAWLFFGNAHRDACYLHQNLWEDAQKAGIVRHINTIFDNEQKGYVQDEILRNGQEVYDWVANRHAIVYVCGRANTVGKGTENALAQLFCEYGQLSQEEAQEKVALMKAEQSLRMDLFG